MAGVKGTELVTALVEMREEDAMELARKYIAEGQSAAEILEQSRAAMEEIGSRFEKGVYFLPELMMAGEMLSEIAELVKPLLAKGGGEEAAAKKPVVLIGTVVGDLHDIGKNIVVFMLEANGFKVIDLGIDVPVNTFVEKVREHQPVVIGLSGFLTLAFDAMRDTVAALQTAGLRQNRKIMIGGGQVDQAICDYTGADAFGMNAMAAVNLCQGWAGKAHSA